MSTSTTCQKCGTLNAEWAKFCAKCGNPLGATLPQQTQTTQPAQPLPPVQPSVPPNPPPPWWTSSAPAPYALQSRTEIDRTKTGLLLLMIGTILGPVPYLNFVGGILAIIGAILVILGRNAFGPDHARNAIWSIIIYIVGIVIIIIGAAAFFFEFVSATIAFRNGGAVNTTQLGQALQSSFNILLIGAVIGGAVTGIAEVLFTYAIQNRNGRLILWAAYGTSLIIGIANVILIGQLVSDAVQRSFVANNFDPGPLRRLQAQFQAFGLLGFIPAALYATALYLVWSRIGRGEIPATSSMPPVSPSPPPTM